MSRVTIKAPQGMIYTNGTDYGRESFLATSDSPDNWWLITEEEYNKILEETMNHEENLH